MPHAARERGRLAGTVPQASLTLNSLSLSAQGLGCLMQHAEGDAWLALCLTSTEQLSFFSRAGPGLPHAACERVRLAGTVPHASLTLNSLSLCVQGLGCLMQHAEGDAWLALCLMHHLAVLPLSKALSNLRYVICNGLSNKKVIRVGDGEV